MDSNFKDRVCALVEQIPAGRVMTYGDIAKLCGNPRASRIVGGIAHYGKESIPWHRLVNRFGGLASGYWGGRKAQAEALANEGVTCDDNYVIINFESVKWLPQNH